MQNASEREIRGLHAFFQLWYRGAIENSLEAFSRLADALAPEFTLITSGGYTFEREQVLGLLRAEHGSKPGLEMWVEDVQLRFATDEVALVTYVERGTTEDGERATLITAALKTEPDTENGLAWVHIHEVSLPPQGS
jgi:hypothetical protein